MNKTLRRLAGALAAVLTLTLAAVPALAASGRTRVVLTKEESDYVEASDVVTVALSPDNFPYSTVQNGRMVGIFPELLSLISYETGLQFQVLPCDTYQDYVELKNHRAADVVFATHVDENAAAKAGYRLTGSYMSIPYSKLELRQNKADQTQVAALRMPSAEATVAARYYYSDQILYCESMEACLQALDSRQCEAVITNSYEAGYLQYADLRGQYVVRELYDNTVEISAGVLLSDDILLYQVLNKALAAVDDQTKEEIINRNSQQRMRDTTITEIVYTQPVLALGAVAVFFVMALGLVVLAFRARSAGMEKEKAEDYTRFLGYICTAVDAVTELNVKDRSMTRYRMQEGALQQDYELYPEDEWMMFHPDDRERVRGLFSKDKLWHLCRTESAAYCECRMLWNHASQYHWCTCILQGIRPVKGKPFNLLLILKDTQEIKTNEEKQRKALEDAFELAKQASQAKGTFLSKMSHEIRTPLNAIIGYLSIAKDAENSPEKIMHCVDNSEIAAKHLLGIINDVLDISSIESGKMKIAREEFDLKKEITDISTIFYQNAKTKGVRFEVHLNDLTEEWVTGDSLRLNQVLMNLLSNAVKFTPEDGLVTLSISQLRKDEKQVYIRFAVQDTGIGMSEEYMNRLFNPFEQESATTAQKYGGTGLGLSITGNLITMMGGTIDVKSKQGEGSTFTVTMHFGLAAKHAPAQPVDYSRVRALVVDDQKEEGTYVKTLLKRCGVKADTVTSGPDAIKRLRGRQGTDYNYDLCILDWNMPQMNGVEVAGRIRQEFGEKLPIIIATAYDITAFEDEARAAGVNKVVAKPLFQSTLFDLLVSSFGKYDPAVGTVPAPTRADLTGLRVLLAEDNAMNMEIAVTVLEKAGVQVTQAVNGQQAVDKFLAAPAGSFDLILMDVQMPVLNGYQATRTIRASEHAEAATIPIVAMTANAFSEDVAEALSNGMNAHIAKPVNYDKLFAVLQKFSK